MLLHLTTTNLHDIGIDRVEEINQTECMSQYDSLIDQFQEKLKFAPDFKKTVKFVIADEGDDAIVIDCSERPARVTEGDDEADVTLIAKLDVFKGLMDGTQDPNMAFMMRRLKIKGSMGVAMRLNAILED